MEKAGDKEGALQPDLLRQMLKGTLFDGKIFYYESIGSTNTRAKEIGKAGGEEGTVVVAEEQTEGRGRLGRQWLSPPGANLLFSVMLRPALRADELFVLTVSLALAAAESIEAGSGVGCQIKWPNDLYVGRKKLGGILTEFVANGKDVESVVVGLGVNVNWRPQDDPGEGYQATSLLEETGKQVRREWLLVDLLNRFENYYERISRKETREIFEMWNNRSLLFGRWVEIRTGRGRVCGIAKGIDETGALVVIDDQGEENRVLSGDVSVERIGKRRG